MRLCIVIMAFLVIGTVLWQEGYRINMTPSMPKGLYKKSADTKIQHGDIVSFCLGSDFALMAKERGFLQAGMCPSEVQPLLKYVAGLEGDMVEITEKGICITPTGSSVGCLWFGVQKRDRHGSTLKSFLQEGIIKQGQALLMTPHKGSFDGRYFGTVSVNTLTKMEKE